MYNIEKVKEAFENLVTFKDVAMTGYEIDYDYEQPVSGVHFSSFDSVLTIENIYEVFRESVKENENFDINKTCNDYVSECTISVLNSIMRKKKMRFETKSLLGSTKLMHDKFARFERITKQNRFVGLKFSCFNDLGVLIKLLRAGFGFTEQQTNFKLYVYNSNVIEAISIITIPAINLDNKFVWQDIEPIELSWFYDYADIGGYWYVGYYEDELQGQAFTRSVEVKSTSCISCNQLESTYYQKYKSYLDFEGFYVESENFVIGESFEEQHSIKSDSNFGLNFHIQVNCDLTEFIIMNKELFYNCIGYKVAVRFYEDLQSDIRDNTVAQRLKALAPIRLYNSENGDKGLYSKLEEAINEVDFEMSNIYSKCLPCIDRSRNYFYYDSI